MLIAPEDFKETFLAAEATGLIPHAGVSLTSSSQVERTQALNVLCQLPLQKTAHSTPTNKSWASEPVKDPRSRLNFLTSTESITPIGLQKLIISL